MDLDQASDSISVAVAVMIAFFTLSFQANFVGTLNRRSKMQGSEYSLRVFLI